MIHIATYQTISKTSYLVRSWVQSGSVSITYKRHSYSPRMPRDKVFYYVLIPRK